MAFFVIGCSSQKEIFHKVEQRAVVEGFEKQVFFSATSSSDIEAVSPLCLTRGSRDPRIKSEDDTRSNLNGSCYGQPSIVCYKRILNKSKRVHVYVEGDGLAWLAADQISPDPTPKDPMGLRLALADKSNNSIVYLARPCQISQNQYCHHSVWTSKRFTQDRINQYHEILDSLKNNHSIKEFYIIGYSGGAAIALLLAAQRDDIKRIITFAGLLDVDKWISCHNYISLDPATLNPAHYIDKLSKISQYHFVGTRDSEIPFSVSKAFQNEKNNFFKIENYSHNSSWDKIWEVYQIDILK
ncbi:MAG: alpha/beta hydrolase [Alphaproteobacteria bacterium]